MLGRLLQALGGLLVGLLLAEGVMRLAFPQTIAPSLYEFDPYSFNIHRPNVEGDTRLHYPDRDLSYHVRINSQRLRDREHSYAKPPGTFRILALGDSMTFGVGVAADEAWPQQLQRLFDARRQPVEVINGGVASWGTAQELPFFLSEGRRYAPDLVILNFTSNDPFDNVRRGIYRMEGGKLVNGGPFPPSRAYRYKALFDRVPGSSWLVEHSLLLNALRQEVNRILSRPAAGANAQTDGWAELVDATARVDTDTEFVTYPPDFWQLTAALLPEFDRQVRQAGGQLVIAIFPFRGEAQHIAAGGPDVDRTVPMMVEKICAEQQLSCINVARELVRQGATDWPRYYIPRDLHFTPAGHALVAGAIYDALAQAGRVPAPR